MIALAVKVTIVFAIALLASKAARNAAASTRHLILVAAQAVALLLPLLGLIVLPIKVDSAMAQTVARIDAAPRVAAMPAGAPAPPSQALDLSSIWLLGTAAIALQRIVSYARALMLARRAAPFGDVFVSDEIDQPMTFGRRILLPPGVETCDAVLAHERAHLARHDSLVALIGDIACAVFWFHPLAWMTARRAVLERERACDEAVLARGIAATSYAEVLVEFARRIRRPSFQPVAGSHLETRVLAILDSSKRVHATRGARLLVLACAIVVAPLLAAFTLRGIEPDLLGDEVAPPYSERIGVDMPRGVSASGPDAALIARMLEIAAEPPREPIDFVPDRARWALTRVRGGELVMPMIEALGDGDWRVRAYAAFGLGVSRDPRATSALAAHLRDPIWRVRAMCAFALAQIADPASASAVRGALDDDAWQVRTEAVHYFAAIHADRRLFESMRDDRHAAVREAAMEALQ